MPAYVLLLVFLLSSLAARAQQQYTVADFSPLYVAKIYVAQPQDVFSPGWIAIHDKQSGRELLKVEAEKLGLRRGGQPWPTTPQLAYAEQNIIISQDFNFDGRPDLAVEDGQNRSCRAPSYRVFLATAAGLRADSAFTRLTRRYCGMFYADAQNKRLVAMNSRGRGNWRERAEFVVRDNAPVLVKRVAEDFRAFPFAIDTIDTWNGQELTRKVDCYLAQEHQWVVCSFPLVENSKRIVLLVAEKRLYYALLRKDDTVELGYPTPADEAATFALRKLLGGLSLQFQRGANQYEIRETAAGTLTVTAQAGAKTRTLTAATGKKGVLRPLLTAKLANLTVHP